MQKALLLTGISFVALICLLQTAAAEELEQIRIAHFPNITHAQALLARANGEYEKETGKKIVWTTVTAGPSVVEAVFAGELDLAYIGPNPAINGYIKSGGRALRIIAGAASGGAALVLRPDSPVLREGRFQNAVIATPQLGNTQDVAARRWFKEHHYKVDGQAGSVRLLPTPNANQSLLMRINQIDGAWTVEPWVSLMEVQLGAKVFIEEKDLWPKGLYPTAYLVAAPAFIQRYPDIVSEIVRAHVRMTSRLGSGGPDVKKTVREEIKRETGADMPETVIDRCFARLIFTFDPMEAQLKASAEAAKEVGFLPASADIKGIFDLSFLARGGFLLDTQVPQNRGSRQ